MLAGPHLEHLTAVWFKTGRSKVGTYKGGWFHTECRLPLQVTIPHHSPGISTIACSPKAEVHPHSLYTGAELTLLLQQKWKCQYLNREALMK